MTTGRQKDHEMMLFATEKKRPHVGPTIWNASMELDACGIEHRKVEVTTEYLRPAVNNYVVFDDERKGDRFLQFQPYEYYNLLGKMF